MDAGAFSSVVPHLLAMAGLVVASAFFAGSETAFFSLSRATRERLLRSARSIDRYVANLASDARRLISTLLVGNELINISFAALSTIVTERLLRGYDVLTITFVATAITVPLLLFLGEILPKTIALAVAEGWARFAARPLGVFMLVTTPVRWVISGVTGGILRLFGLKLDARPSKMGEAELRDLVDVGSETGELQAEERRLIHRVFDFGDRMVARIMTPARDVFSLSFELPMARLAAEVAKSGFSRVPIHRGKKHEIVGLLLAKDLVGMSMAQTHKSLADLIRPVFYVPKNATCAQVFQEFRRRHTHFALVVDEYGQQVGVVTMEDLLGDLFGKLHEDRPASPSDQPPEELH
jgi:putative hemolysin